METKKKRTGLLGKIENREGALKTIKESAYASSLSLCYKAPSEFFLLLLR